MFSGKISYNSEGFYSRDAEAFEWLRKAAQYIMRTTEKRTLWQWAAVAGQLGFAMIIPVVLCTAAAYWLSIHFSLGGWVVIFGIFLGLGGSAVSFLKVVRILQTDTQKQEDKDA